MKIAVTYENQEVFQHFGHSKHFKIYNCEEEKVINSEIIDTNGTGHGDICKMLVQNKVDILICGGLGSGAKELLNENNIKIYSGVTGNADEKVKDLLKNKLEYNNDIKCEHHNHHEEEHNCKSHNCAEEKGGCKGNK